MIKSTVILGNGHTAPAITGYTSIREAVRALRQDWPLLVVEYDRHAVMRDYDGSELLLVDDFEFDLSAITPEQEIVSLSKTCNVRIHNREAVEDDTKAVVIIRSRTSAANVARHYPLTGDYAADNSARISATLSALRSYKSKVVRNEQ